MQQYGLTYPFLQREKDEASWSLDMASERSCSVAMSDRRVMSQYRNFVIMLSGASATHPT